MLGRRWETLQTEWGPVKIKYGILNGKTIKAKPEYDDCLRIANEYQLPLQFVTDEVRKIISSK
jgi:uncharacterized protein (DUF111 family)